VRKTRNRRGQNVEPNRIGALPWTRIGLLALAAVAAVGVTAGALRWEDSRRERREFQKLAQARLQADADAVPVEFTVPQPGDPEYEDYREMLAHPAYRSSVENSPGYAMPYDPEWRAPLVGRREAEETDLQFVSGAGSLRELIRGYLDAVESRDPRGAFEMAVTKDEFQLILWREFPQSRPFLRIPPDEAWLFQLAKMEDGIMEALESYAGRSFELEHVKAGKVSEFRNFVLYEDLSIHVLDTESQEQGPLRVHPTVAERDGRFKFLGFSD
jgi:hypothetical protein